MLFVQWWYDKLKMAIKLPPSPIRNQLSRKRTLQGNREVLLFAFLLLSDIINEIYTNPFAR